MTSDGRKRFAAWPLRWKPHGRLSPRRPRLGFRHPGLARGLLNRAGVGSGPGDIGLPTEPNRQPPSWSTFSRRRTSPAACSRDLCVSAPRSVSAGRNVVGFISQLYASQKGLYRHVVGISDSCHKGGFVLGPGGVVLRSIGFLVASITDICLDDVKAPVDNTPWPKIGHARMEVTGVEPVGGGSEALLRRTCYPHTDHPRAGARRQSVASPSGSASGLDSRE